MVIGIISIIFFYVCTSLKVIRSKDIKRKTLLKKKERKLDEKKEKLRGL